MLGIITTIDIAMILESLSKDKMCCVNCYGIASQLTFCKVDCVGCQREEVIKSVDPSFDIPQITRHPVLHLVSHLMKSSSKRVTVSEDEKECIFHEIEHVSFSVLKLIMDSSDLMGVIDCERQLFTVRVNKKTTVSPRVLLPLYRELSRLIRRKAIRPHRRPVKRLVR